MPFLRHTLILHLQQTWWRHQMETFSALLAICAGNLPVTGDFPAQRPVTQSFDVFFVLRLNKRLSKQSWGWWFETLSCPLWRHCNENGPIAIQYVTNICFKWVLNIISFVNPMKPLKIAITVWSFSNCCCSLIVLWWKYCYPDDL